jgi:hypothetical protein
MQRIANAGPRGRIRRRHETILSSGCRSVRNAFEDFDAPHFLAANFAERGLRNHGVLTGLFNGLCASEDGAGRGNGKQRRLL